MARLMRTGLCITLLCAVIASGEDIDGDTWGLLIDHAGRQRMLSQKMAKEFLQIAKGIKPADSRENLTGTVNMFDSTLFHLRNGTREKGYAPPPSQLVAEALEVVNGHWGSFKALLEGNMVTVSSSDQLILKEVMDQSLTLLKTSNGVVGKTVDAAKATGAKVAGLVVDIAGRQRMLTQKMAKEVLLVGLKVDAQTNLAALAETSLLFDQSHQGILRGTNYVDIPALTSMCTLWQMSRVSAKWEEVDPVVMGIMDYGEASDETLRQMTFLNMVLLDEMKKAVVYYIKDGAARAGTSDPPTCTYADGMDASSWSKLINTGGKQRMMGQKASRLFFQIARNIKVTESQVELSTTLSTGSTSLRVLIEGSQRDGIPPPPTQEIATQLTDIWAGWKIFSDMLTEASTSGTVSSTVLMRIARLSRSSLTGMNDAVQMMTLECLRVMPVVNPVVINIAGAQRMLMQQMSKEAISVVNEFEMGLTEEAEQNQLAVERTIKSWLDVHWMLLLGREQNGTTTALVRTTDVCLLRQMKSAFDRFNDLMPMCRELAARSMWLTRTEVDATLEQIHEVNGPAFAAMNTAVGMFASSHNTCELGLSLDEWQQVFLRMGRAELMIEDLTTEYLLQAIGGIVLEDDSQDRRLQDQDGQGEQAAQGEQAKVPSMMSSHIAEFDEMLFLLKYGNETQHVSTAPSQQIADHLFNLTDAWEHLKALLTSKVDRNQAEELLELSTHMSLLAGQTMDLYEEQAMLYNNQSGWRTIGRVSQEPAALTRLVRDAALLSFTDCRTCITQGARLETSISTFDALVRPIDEQNGQVAVAMQSFLNEWDILKATLVSVVANFNELQSIPEASQMAQIALQSSVAKDTAARTIDVLISLTQTTTRIPLDILVPLPLTGSWDAGESMRAAILVAQDLINTQQKILPGYTLVSHFADDECDDESIVQLVLEEQSANQDIIALGGVGCQVSCEALARVAPSMLLPFLSYACPGRSLSDNITYKNFARMGGNMHGTPGIVKALADRFGWTRVALVVGDETRYGPGAHALEKHLKDEGLDVVYMAEDKGGSFAQTRALAEQFKEAKERVLFMLGDESFKRRLVCASRVVGANIGISWITEGAHSRGWLVQADSSLDSECTVGALEESFDGAINIVDSDTPLDGQEELALECFEDETSRSFLELAERAAVEGFPAGDNTTSAQKRFDVFAKAADGTCALAFAVRNLLGAGVGVDELRKPSKDVYEKFHTVLRRGTSFRGASGEVFFEGNDEVGHVLIRQRRANADDETRDSMPWVETTVGIQFANGTLALEGLSDEAYKEALTVEEAQFPFEALQAVIITLFICCPFCLGLCYVMRRHSAAQTEKGGPGKGGKPGDV